ncbi:MAG: hypothetical protein ABI199_01880 [Bacteroidia bacterium]
MKIIEVNSASTEKDFLNLPRKIYQNDKNWIAHLQQDIRGVFDKKSNKYFEQGEAIRWILKNEKQETIGRVAAFINYKTADTYSQQAGGMGFFECINDKKAAFLLFDKCKEWLAAKGMRAMDGPVNFGEKDRYWGLLIENFTSPPLYLMNYQPTYYKDFFETYGFQVFYEQIVFHRKVHAPLQQVYIERSERIAKNPKYHLEHIKKNNLEKYAEDFRTIYNAAWAASHENFKEMPKEQAMKMVKELKPVIEEELIWFAYYDETPIGFYIALPELNEIFKHVGDNFNWLGKIKFLWQQKTKSCKTAYGLAFGVAPRYQGKGIEGAIFDEFRKALIKKGNYEDVVIAWIGDFNPKMIRVIEAMGAIPYRKLATYRKLFDENAPFERYPILS